MSNQSEAFWNQGQSYIDFEFVETANCVLMFKPNGDKLEKEWVPIRNVYDMKENGWNCHPAFNNDFREKNYN